MSTKEESAVIFGFRQLLRTVYQPMNVGDRTVTPVTLSPLPFTLHGELPLSFPPRKMLVLDDSAYRTHE